MATTTVSTTTESRPKKKIQIKPHLKKAQPALGDLGGAVGGWVIGEMVPSTASAILGAGLLITGAYTKRSWVTSTGVALVVTTIATSEGANNRTSATGRMNAKTEMHNGKERVKSFLKSFGGKLQFWKKKPVDDPDAEHLDGLGMLDAEHFANLDQLNRNLIAQGYELAASEGYPIQNTMEYPGVVHF